MAVLVGDVLELMNLHLKRLDLAKSAIHLLVVYQRLSLIQLLY